MTPSELKSLLEKRAAITAKKYLEKDKAQGYLKSLARKDFKAGHASTHELICELATSLQELADLMESTIQGEYTPDGFTCQPARLALEKLRAELETK